MTDQTKAITVTNYDKIRAMASNEITIKRFTDMLGNRSSAMSYISSAMLAVANSDDLMACTPSSVMNSVMRAAALRLSCDPATKQAYIVPFNHYDKKTKQSTRQAQFIPGYIGLNQLAQRTGKYRHLNTSPLYEGQALDINQLTGEPVLRGQKKNADSPVIGYFHYFELFNGFKHALYMTVEELRAHGEKYAPSNPKWKSDFSSMAKKTVTRLHLLHDGILDPFDREQIEAAADEISGGEMVTETDTIDGTFTESDDETAAAEAAAAAIEKANAPKRSEADLMAEITGEPAPKPATQPEPEQPGEGQVIVIGDPNAEDQPDEGPYNYPKGAKLGGKNGHTYPNEWTRYFMSQYKRTNEFEVDGILQFVRPDWRLTAEEVAAKDDAHLDKKEQAQKQAN